jgi:DNA-binding CsgD family transcriptional regulator
MSRAAILAITRRSGPMTAKQLAMEMGMGESTVRTCIRRSRAGGRTDILRIAGWAGDVPLYGPGPGDDEEGGNTGERVLQSLRDQGPATASELAERLGITASVVDSAVRRIRKTHARLKMHITGWRLHRGSGGREAAIHAAGTGKDAPRPSFGDAAQRQAERRYQERQRVQRGAASMRKPRKPQAGPMAGFFDGLMR